MTQKHHDYDEFEDQPASELDDPADGFEHELEDIFDDEIDEAFDDEAQNIWINPHQVTDNDEEPEERVYAERPNKKRLKQQVKSNQDLVRKLIALTPNQLDKIELPEALRDNIIEGKRIIKANVAFKRQLQYTTRLMGNEEVDVDHIAQQLAHLHRPHREAVARLHKLEQWRDALLAGDQDLLHSLIHEWDDFDTQYVRQLIRNAQRETKQNKPPKSARLLFQYLQARESD